MFYKNTLLLLLFLFCTSNAFSAIFVVTSNADAGPGTLREALTLAAANGTTVKDYINFNIADVSEAGRTITLISSLPNITSNLVIDGTTQSGINLGRSNAKITIQPSNSSDTYGPFTLPNVDGFEIYGLYVRDFIGVFPFQGSTVFYVTNCKNIQIGSPGKGNVFTNNGYVFTTIYGHYYGNVVTPAFNGVENLTVYSNFFGFEPDGKTYRGPAYGYSPDIDLSGCAGNILIGGLDASQRNLFGNTINAISCTATVTSTSHTTTFKIINNYFNYNIDGQYSTLPSLNASSIETITLAQNPGYVQTFTLPYSAYIMGNKIQAPAGISAGIFSGPIIFQGNQVINENYPNKPSYGAGGLNFQSVDSIKIGGINPGEANTLYNCGIQANSTKSILIQRNSDYCINNGYDVVWQLPYLVSEANLPVIAIKNITSTSVSGTATPLSQVELFEDDDCQYCLPLTYITTVTTDANGNWTYTGSVNKGIIASATLNGFTSYFTRMANLKIDSYVNYKITQYSCGQNGSILGLNFENTGGYHWTNAQGTVIGSSPQISNLVPGKYTITAENGTCSTSNTFEIFDATPQIIDTYKQVTQPSCGNSNGSVTNLNLSINNNKLLQTDYSAYTYKWTDPSGKVRNTGFDLTNAEAGVYHLEVSYKNLCKGTYDITLTNTTGPNINQTATTIQGSNCGTSMGSITNISATGTGALTYTWKNSQQQVVATTNDLLNQPTGKYILQVTDQGSCGPVFSSEITIPELNGVTIDDSQIINTPAMCQSNNGSITGIITTGATSYKWIDGTGNVISTQVNLTGAMPGSYYLLAANATCSKQSTVYTITRQTNTTNYGGLSKKLTDATCDLNNGSIEVIFTDAPITPLPVFYRWVNSAGQTVGTNSRILSNIDAGTYQLYVSDINGCEKFLVSYSIGRIPGLTVVHDNVKIINDQCENSAGSIKGIGVTGRTPLNFTWTDATSKTISNTPDLLNIKAGTYTIKITDGSGCEKDLSYTILNENSIVPLPKVSNLQLCSAGPALLAVNTPSTAYSYRLYDSGTSTMPIDTKASGIFNIAVSANRSYYVSQYTGNCESERAEIKISLGISKLNISNTFTPNNDGINDTWKINGLENYPNAIIQIYNRSGQVVYESKGYTLPFDGHMNGHDLPVGTYYYMINLNSKCGLISGSLTLIR